MGTETTDGRIMELNDLLRAADVDIERTLVLRHRPSETAFRKALPLLASERLDLFEAYQAYQGEPVERMFTARMGGSLASFLSYGPGQAIYVGTYRIDGACDLDRGAFWSEDANQQLRALGTPGWREDEVRPTRLRVDLRRTPVSEEWRGKLIVSWPPPERSWVRVAANNVMPVVAIREDSAFAAAVPRWDEMDYSWAELKVLPQRVRHALGEWRGIYLIWDQSDGKSYVGSAYGGTNILGRWERYAATGHGGNKLLRKRTPNTFRFSILQRTSPDLEDAEIIRLENNWKERLHTRSPYGLNDN